MKMDAEKLALTRFNEAVGYYRRKERTPEASTDVSRGFNEAVGYYRRKVTPLQDDGQAFVIVASMRPSDITDGKVEVGEVTAEVTCGLQ